MVVSAQVLGPRSLEQLARELATGRSAARGSADFRPRVVLRQLRRRLNTAYSILAEAQSADRPISPSAQWVLDNFHVVTGNLDALIGQLSPALLAELPVTAPDHCTGPDRWYRVHWLLEKYVHNTHGRVQVDSLTALLRAFQAIAPLTMAELWATPSFLRLLLLVQLRDIAEGAVRAMAARERADQEADAVLRGSDGEDEAVGAGSVPIRFEPPGGLEPEVQALAYFAQLIQRLRFRGEAVASHLAVIENLLRDKNLSIDECVRREQQRQGVNNVAAANAISSLRELEAVDWRDTFEALSVVEEVLRPAPGYRAVDAATRDQYRHAVAELARGSGRSEQDVAGTLCDALQGADPPDAHWRDIGWYLIADGRPEIERRIGYRPRVMERLLRSIRRVALPAYIGSIALATAVILWLVARQGLPGNPGVGATLLLVAAAFPASDLALRLINVVVMRAFHARPLPRMASGEELPPEARTLVVMPVMLTGETAIRALAAQLEVHALATAEPEVYYALLSDWPDAPVEETARDRELRRAAEAAIATLNDRHPVPFGTPLRFHLLHRRRQWNGSEGCWMGWERKRGKLVELNRLLLRSRPTSFLSGSDDEPGAGLPRDVRYVLTLDADTRLPIGSVRKLLAAALHPLNRPRHRDGDQRVVAGYAVFQPRVTPLLPEDSRQSLYQWAISGESGMDPYAGAVSDAYQDLFGRGIYTGKGLYDVASFHRALEDRLPDNTVLSHDLLEGSFARCALVSDVELYEEFPSHSEVAAARTHRWTRGDWQLLPWLIGARARGLGALPRWQLLDNLRRSLTAPAAVATLVAAWSLPAVHDTPWVLLVLAPFFVPGMLGVVSGVATSSPLPRRVRLRAALADLRDEAARGFIGLALLGQHAWLATDAVLRTLVRLRTHRRLLEWVTAASVQSRARNSLPAFVWPLKSSSVIVIATTALLVQVNPAALPGAAPWLLLVWLSPVVAWLLSQPRVRSGAGPLKPADQLELRTIARETWAYFETFVTPEDHHLPPDNFQAEPAPVLARRTSPTNIGLYLLATATARDFGWLGLHEMCIRLSATFDTLTRLDHWRGHLYNWYDTASLAPLPPRYVSVVDSGNLAGHLLALEMACRDQAAAPVLATGTLMGLSDTLRCFEQALLTAPRDRRATVATITELGRRSAALAASLAAMPADPVQAEAALQEWLADAAELVDLAAGLAAELGESDAPWLAWGRRLVSNAASHLGDYRSLLPLELLAASPGVAAAFGEIAGSAGLYDRFDTLPERCRAAAAALPSTAPPELATVLGTLASRASGILAQLAALATVARDVATQMDFACLYDRRRGLFAIGWRVDDGVADTSFYDLLASEARLASLVAIALRQVPVRHWFRLGRPLAGAPGAPLLFSWSGSMFEYLMPALVLHEPPGSLLDVTCERAVELQIRHGRHQGLPWGVSESAFNVRDQEQTYQYSDFGVPGLGLKRGLGRYTVVAPYATALATTFDATAAARNFRRLASYGARGAYGFCEAIDFTPVHLPAGSPAVVVRAWMAHHQGMSLVALGNTLLGRRMQARFHRQPIIQAAALLLQERPPRRFRALPRPTETPKPRVAGAGIASVGRHITMPVTELPVAHLLGSPRYAVMLTAAGAGSSTASGLAITRWREDRVREQHGTFLYLRNRDSAEVWSAGISPVAVLPDHYEARLDEDRALLCRTDGDLSTTVEIVVSPEEDAELRRVTLTNGGSAAVTVDVTSYLEVVLNDARADLAHPAFAGLFVATEYSAELGALLATRRPRDAGTPTAFAVHLVVPGPGTAGPIQYETDRLRFLGRGGDVRAPLAVMDGRRLSNTTGPVLDPVFSLRVPIVVQPGGKVSVVFATLHATSRQAALEAADRLGNPDAFERASMLAWTAARATLQFLGMRAQEARLYQSLVTHIVYATPHLQAAQDRRARNRLSVAGLWRLGISGDRPLVVVRCLEDEHAGFAAELVRAQRWWTAKGLAVDLVLLNERPHSYLQNLQHELEALGREQADTIFVLRRDALNDDDMNLLFHAARIVLDPGEGTLLEQVARKAGVRPVAAPPRSIPARTATDTAAPGLAGAPAPRDAGNGFGGFGPDGREYVIRLSDARQTPAPWSNVIANQAGGFLVTERGAGYTFVGNARENQLTPWSNDPVTDPHGDVLYLRDEQSGDLWTVTPDPVRIPGAEYVIVHEQGCTTFRVRHAGIEAELTLAMGGDDPVRYGRLRLVNQSGQPRRIAVACYVEWVLGAGRPDAAGHVVTEVLPGGGLAARNPWSVEFGQRVAFVDLAGTQSWTGSRSEFIGRHGSLAAPAGLLRQGSLSNRIGVRWDACGALRTSVDLAAGGTATLPWLLGQGRDEAESTALVARWRAADPDAVIADARARWSARLDVLQVQTPDESLNHLVNRWLPYQALGCRLLGRTGFYQAGGAFGFRDQLQDCLALLVSAPELVREHLVRAAGRQFEAGDVQHWWHPPSGRGVRTRCVDDRLWLPFVTLRYLEVTGDSTVLDEPAGFLADRPLKDGEDDAYFQPEPAGTEASLWEHCARAIDISLGTGPHGLPLMGGGDWNDGMNRVGNEGHGESTWMAWFLCALLPDGARLAVARGEPGRAGRWQAAAASFAAAAEAAWDGGWYRRGYFDDGTPLGSATQPECRIDSLAQSWAVISAAGDPARAAQAMAAVDEQLVDRASGLILLFKPPFEHRTPDPGYIRGYLPGLRENGGQYTHAAAWVLIAAARLGRLEHVGELLQMLNPAHRSSSRRKAHEYRVEPYVLAGDIYSEAPHAGRGGWTWYTGAAGWLYQAVVEEILGLRVRAGRLELAPRLPPDWPEAALRFRRGKDDYRIEIQQAGTGFRLTAATLDGSPLPVTDGPTVIPLAGDGREHRVRLVLGP